MIQHGSEAKVADFQEKSGRISQGPRNIQSVSVLPRADEDPPLQSLFGTSILNNSLPLRSILFAPVGSSGFLEGQGVRVCLRAKTIAEQRNESTQLEVHELTTTHATISAWRTEWPVLGQRPLKLDQAGANSSSPPCEYGVVHWIA